MKRSALIIYCPNANPEKPLAGPPVDNDNFVDFLTSKAGGNWRASEILSLEDPDSKEVLAAVEKHHAESDYTFTIYTGHGFIHKETKRQYVELPDLSIPIIKLKSMADRQTLIVDSCRGEYPPQPGEIMKAFSDIYESHVGIAGSTRKLFEDAVLDADEGWSILYAARRNQSALDTDDGAAYLISLLKAAEVWEKRDKKNLVMTLEEAHDFAKQYVVDNFETMQEPMMNGEKRITHFPFSVKFASLH